MKNFKTIDDLNVAGKRVLLRVDFNVPMQDGKNGSLLIAKLNFTHSLSSLVVSLTRICP
jgi:3-phosphoglycerate kinase